MSKKENNVSPSKLRVIPLGGLEQIGMNITALEYEDSIIVVDCGLAFPQDEMLGIDLVVPDVTYLKDHADKVKGFFITHGHEDHIGSIPYVLREVPAPLYATKLTQAIIDIKLKEFGLSKSVKKKVVKYGQMINVGDFRVEFIRVNHSISDAAAFAITCPVGTVVFTGDFKVDYTPVLGEPIDLTRFGELGKKGVLAMFCDSTNVMRPGFTMSERTFGRTGDNICAENTGHRIIVATLASIVDRVQQIITCAAKYGRKVMLEGRSMLNVMTAAQELKYITIPENTLVSIDQIKSYRPEDTVLITTGSQGESMAALSRIAASIHKRVTISPDDVVIISSTPIPGNEKSVSKVINELTQQGAKVIYQDTHVSGHACQEEIKLLYTLIKPKYAIPVHGEYRHLAAHAELAKSVGIDKDNIFILHSGDVLELNEKEAKVVDHITLHEVLVDGLGVGDVGNAVLRDRRELSESGLVIVSLAMGKGTNIVLAGPEINSRGFVYMRESEEKIEEAKEVVEATLSKLLSRSKVDRNKLKNEIKDALSDHFWKTMKREPVILPIIMEVE